MKTDLRADVKIPSGVTVTRDGSLVTVTGPKGALSRAFVHHGLTITLDSDHVTLSQPKASRKDKRMVYTFDSHLRNMIQGVQTGYRYTLKIAYSHFPMSVAVDKGVVLIKNYLGEKIPRKAPMPEHVTVTVSGDQIVVDSIDKEAAGLMATRLEQAVRITNRDRRVFQDGIWITQKAEVPA